MNRLKKQGVHSLHWPETTTVRMRTAMSRWQVAGNHEQLFRPCETGIADLRDWDSLLGQPMLSDVGFCNPFIKRQLHIHCRSPTECVWGGEIHALREIRRTGDASLRFLTKRRDYLQSSEHLSLIFYCSQLYSRPLLWVCVAFFGRFCTTFVRNPPNCF